MHVRDQTLHAVIWSCEYTCSGIHSSACFGGISTACVVGCACIVIAYVYVYDRPAEGEIGHATCTEGKMLMVTR